MVSPAATLASEWTFCTASFIILLIRLWVRRYVAKVGIQLEDGFMILAQALFFCWVSIDAFTISQGFMNSNKSYYDGIFTQIYGDDGNKQRVLKLVYASSIPYYLCIWCIKAAILGFYFRLIPRKTKTRVFLYITTAVTGLTIIAVVLINIFLCHPISLNWSLSSDHVCYSSTAVVPFLISAIANLITDIFIFIVPFPLLRSLKSLPYKQKIGLVVTFSFGLITIIVFIARSIAIALSGAIALAAILTAVECFTASTVASLPYMKILLKSKRLRLRISSKNSNKTQDDDLEDSILEADDSNALEKSANATDMLDMKKTDVIEMIKFVPDPTSPESSSSVQGLPSDQRNAVQSPQSPQSPQEQVFERSILDRALPLHPPSINNNKSNRTSVNRTSDSHFSGVVILRASMDSDRSANSSSSWRTPNTHPVAASQQSFRQSASISNTNVPYLPTPSPSNSNPFLPDYILTEPLPYPGNIGERN